MIKVNLIPPEAGKRQAAAGKSFKLPKAGVVPYVLGIVAVIGVAGYMAYSGYSQLRKSADNIAKATKTKAAKQAEIKSRQEEFEKNNALSREIEEKFAVVQALGPENRIFWSEKLNMMARARLNLPVYITKLALTEVITQIETEESVKRRKEWAARPVKKAGDKEPPKIMQPIINQTLEIEAIAYGTDSSQRLRQITNFMAALQSLEWERASGVRAAFMDGMVPEYESLPHKLTKVGGVQVLRFGVKIKALPQQDRTSAAKKKSAASQGVGRLTRETTGAQSK